MYIHIIWAISPGRGGGGTKSTSGINSQVKESSYKKGEDWFEPILNIRTPLFPSLLHFFFLHSENHAS